MEFIVTKSTQSTKGGFVNSLEGSAVTKVFGVAKTSKHLFLFKTDETIVVGTKGELNLADYRQESYKWTDDDGAERNSTWLHAIAK